jgi:outer membrane protein TolC
MSFMRARRILRPLRCLSGVTAAAALLTGCATYHAQPLSLVSPLKSGLSALNRSLQAGRRIKVNAPLSAQALAALAVLNDPALVALRAQAGVARAQVFASALLPDPNIQGGFMALLGGPGSAPSIAGAISQDIAALVTRGARVRAAKARAAATDADVLWQEFQVAAQAETLATALYADQRSLAALDGARDALSDLVKASNHAIAAGTVTIDQAATAEASLAGLDGTRDAIAQQRQIDHAALAGLLGVTPDTSIVLARPVIPARTQGEVARLLGTLAQRRPDLIALRYGYVAADADLRAAILAQFPLVSLSVNGGSDTSRVASVGPTLSVNLPIFNGNRGNVAVARATRRQLNAAFGAALGAAQGGAAAAAQALGVLEAERATAKIRVITADRAADSAKRAWSQGLIDSRTEADLINQQATRRYEVIALDQKIAAGRIALASLLGVGLPIVHAVGGSE